MGKRINGRAFDGQLVMDFFAATFLLYCFTKFVVIFFLSSAADTYGFIGVIFKGFCMFFEVFLYLNETAPLRYVHQFVVLRFAQYGLCGIKNIQDAV